MTRKTHILLVPDWYPSPEDPVAGMFMRDLARAVSTGHVVTVVAPPSESAPAETDEDGFRTIRLPPFGSGWIGLTTRLRALNAVIGRLREEGRPPDLIHGHVFVGGFFCVLVGRRWRLPVVITENYSGFLERRLTWKQARVARFTYRRADVVCPVSSLLECSLVEIQPRGRYEVVPDVVDVAAFGGDRAPARPGARTRVIAVSLLIRRKGVHDLVDAVRLLSDAGQEISLTVVGDGPERAKLEAQARGLPIAFTGALPRERVVGLVRDSHVFAMPTHADPFGIAAVEALAAGIPVVVTSASGTATLIAENGGQVVPPGDPPALAAAIGELLDTRTSVPSDVASRIDGVCGPGAVATRLDSIYRSVLEGR